MIIPIEGVPDEKFSISLNNSLYQFRIQYNERFDFWIFSMFLNDVPLFEGLRMVQGIKMTEQYNLDIGGYFEILSISGDPADPTRDDLGNDKVLNFVPTVSTSI